MCTVCACVACIYRREFKMKSVLLLVLGFSLVTAQTPERCDSPPSWHARISRSEFEGGRRAFIRGRIAYDEANERFRILEGEETHDGSIRVFTGRYYFYKEKYEVFANFTSEKCEKRPLNESFRPFSIPYDAKYLDTIEIGSDVTPGAGVEVQIWGGQTESGGFYTGTWTTKDCIPVNDQYFSNYFSAETFFYNVEGGFSPDDFDPPSFCN